MVNFFGCGFHLIAQIENSNGITHTWMTANRNFEFREDEHYILSLYFTIIAMTTGIIY